MNPGVTSIAGAGSEVPRAGRRPPISRRSASLRIGAGIVGCACASMSGCARAAAARRVVLYSSVDEDVIRPLLPMLSARAGATIELVGDSEATKTFGLVKRLEAEASRPRADVWWSSEPFGTLDLAAADLLAPAEPPPGWPEAWRDPRGMWHAFACRFRVMARLAAEKAPALTLDDLTHESHRGTVGMARPQFGTTRGHMGAIRHAWGPARFEAWLDAMRANRLRLFDGNATVVRALEDGSIRIGVTDSDDVYAAQARGVRLAFAHVRSGLEEMVIPSTAAIVRGGPNPAGALRLLHAVLGPEVAAVLASSHSRNAPVDPALRARLTPEAPAPDGPGPLAEISASIGPAVEACERILGA